MPDYTMSFSEDERDDFMIAVGSRELADTAAKAYYALEQQIKHGDPSRDRAAIVLALEILSEKISSD